MSLPAFRAASGSSRTVSICSLADAAKSAGWVP